MTTQELYAGGAVTVTVQLATPPTVAAGDTMTGLLEQAMAAMQAIIDTPDVAFANLANAQTAMRALQAQVRQEAQLLRRLIRLTVGDFTGTG